MIHVQLHTDTSVRDSAMSCAFARAAPAAIASFALRGIGKSLHHLNVYACVHDDPCQSEQTCHMLWAYDRGASVSFVADSPIIVPAGTRTIKAEAHHWATGRVVDETLVTLVGAPSGTWRPLALMSRRLDIPPRTRAVRFTYGVDLVASIVVYRAHLHAHAGATSVEFGPLRKCPYNASADQAFFDVRPPMTTRRIVWSCVFDNLENHTVRYGVSPRNQMCGVFVYYHGPDLGRNNYVVAPTVSGAM